MTDAQSAAPPNASPPLPPTPLPLPLLDASRDGRAPLEQKTTSGAGWCCLCGQRLGDHYEAAVRHFDMARGCFDDAAQVHALCQRLEYRKWCRGR